MQCLLLASANSMTMFLESFGFEMTEQYVSLAVMNTPSSFLVIGSDSLALCYIGFIGVIVYFTCVDTLH